jgi:hypothetical protein
MLSDTPSDRSPD